MRRQKRYALIAPGTHVIGYQTPKPEPKLHENHLHKVHGLDNYGRVMYGFVADTTSYWGLAIVDGQWRFVDQKGGHHTTIIPAFYNIVDGQGVLV